MPTAAAGPSLADGLCALALGAAAVAAGATIWPAAATPGDPWRAMATCEVPVEARRRCEASASAHLACAETLAGASGLALAAGDLVCGTADGPARVTAGGMRPSWRLLSGAGLDINRADAASLALLPRIGPRLAARIIAHRRAHGPFARPEALRAVAGIGPRVWEELAPLVVTGP